MNKGSIKIIYLFMTSYQKYILNKYKKYKNVNENNNNLNINEKIQKYCLSRKIQNHQLFLSEYILETNNLLINHLTGSGKTCVSIQIIKALEKTHDIYVIVPASLISNFEYELNETICGEENKYKDKYNLLSIHKFVNEIKNGNMYKKWKNKKIAVIIDEVQNIISEIGTFYYTINTFLKEFYSQRKLILMTATPIVDTPKEFCLLINLFKKEDVNLLDFNENFIKNYKLINKNDFINFCGNYISYYKGAPNYTYPKYNIIYEKCVMKGKQLELYKIEDNITNKSKKFDKVKLNKMQAAFYINLRTISNVVSDNINYNNISLYSCKFVKLYNNLDLTKKIFIYSCFREESGIQTFCNYLNTIKNKNGTNLWKYYFDCSESEKKNVNIYKYFLWTGKENIDIKKEGKKIFDNIKNINGDYIKLVIGSPSSKEGISFKCVRQVHIMEPYWNWSRIYQIYSRAVRFCSHTDLPLKERTVDIYIYLATLENKTKSIDEYLIEIINFKEKLNKQFLDVIKDSSIDKLLFQ